MRCPLTYEQFEDYILFIKSAQEEEDKLNSLFRECFDDSSFYPHTRYETKLIKLLEYIMEDEDTGWISYFIYELNFGEKWKEGFVVDKVFGKEVDIPMKTIRNLYDYLLKEEYTY